MQVLIISGLICSLCGRPWVGAREGSLKPTLVLKELPLTVSSPASGPRHIVHRLSRKRRRKAPKNISDTGIILLPWQMGMPRGGLGVRGGWVAPEVHLVISLSFHLGKILICVLVFPFPCVTWSSGCKDPRPPKANSSQKGVCLMIRREECLRDQPGPSEDLEPRSGELVAPGENVQCLSPVGRPGCPRCPSLRVAGPATRH